MRIMKENTSQDDFEKIDRSRVREVLSIAIDTSLPVPDRMRKFVEEGGDLKWRKKGDSLIKITHSGNGQSFHDNFIEMLNSM